MVFAEVHLLEKVENPLQIHSVPTFWFQFHIFPQLTAFFIVFYFFLVMSYRSIKRTLQESTQKANFDWKIVGLIVSWLISGYTIGQISYFSLLPYSLYSAFVYIVIFLVSGELSLCWTHAMSLNELPLWVSVHFTIFILIEVWKIPILSRLQPWIWQLLLVGSMELLRYEF